MFITTLNLETPAIHDIAWDTIWKWVAYSCPNLMCAKIISVWIDPIAIKTDIINGVLKWLGR